MTLLFFLLFVFCQIVKKDYLSPKPHSGYTEKHTQSTAVPICFPMSVFAEMWDKKSQVLNSSSCLTMCLTLWWAFFGDKPFNKKGVIWFHTAAHLPKLPKGQNDSRNNIPFKYIWTPPNADQENLQTWWILTYSTYWLARSLRTSTVTDVMLLLDVVFHKITQTWKSQPCQHDKVVSEYACPTTTQVNSGICLQLPTQLFAFMY